MKRNIPPTDTRFARPAEATARRKWETDLLSYKKPPHDPLAPREAGLLFSSKTTTALGYVLFQDGIRIVTSDATACEFVFDDPEPLRKAILASKTHPGFHVYFKHGAYWYGVQKHFDTLADAMPYLQSGIRCLIEYRFTKK